MGCPKVGEADPNIRPQTFQGDLSGHPGPVVQLGRADRDIIALLVDLVRAISQSATPISAC
jgi:hypothetical protein